VGSHVCKGGCEVEREEVKKGSEDLKFIGLHV